MKPQQPIRVADILSNSDHWTKGVFARISDRTATPLDAIDVYDERAEQFSLAGAINKAYGRSTIKILPSLIKEQVREHLKEKFNHPFTIDEWNDQPDRTFEEVQSVIQALDL